MSQPYLAFGMRDPLAVARRALAMPRMDEFAASLVMLLAYADVTVKFAKAPSDTWLLRHGHWFDALAAKGTPKAKRALAWVMTPGALGVREDTRFAHKAFCLRAWDIAHFRPHGRTHTPETLLAMAHFQGLHIPGTEDIVAAGARRLVSNELERARALEPWLVSYQGDERHDLHTALQTLRGDLAGGRPPHPNSTTSFAIAANRFNQVTRQPPDGRTLPGLAFNEPFLPYLHDGWVIAPAVERRDDSIRAPVRPVGYPVEHAVATWPARVDPAGVDHQTEADEVFPFVQRRLQRILDIEGPPLDFDPKTAADRNRLLAANSTSREPESLVAHERRRVTKGREG